MRNPTREELDTLRSTMRGCTREKLAEWGIPWPPPSGWRKKLLKHHDPLSLSVRMNRHMTVRDFIAFREEVFRLYTAWQMNSGGWYKPIPDPNDPKMVRREFQPPQDTPWPEELAGITEAEVQFIIK